MSTRRIGQQLYIIKTERLTHQLYEWDFGVRGTPTHAPTALPPILELGKELDTGTIASDANLIVVPK